MDDQTFRNSSAPPGASRYSTWTRFVLVPGSKSFHFKTTALSRIWSSVMLVQVAICTGEVVMVAPHERCTHIAGNGLRGRYIVSFERRFSILMHLSDAYKSDAYEQACRDGKSNYNHPVDFRAHRMPPCTSRS